MNDIFEDLFKVIRINQTNIIEQQKKHIEIIREINNTLEMHNSRLEGMDSKFRALRQNELSKDPVE